MTTLSFPWNVLIHPLTSSFEFTIILGSKSWSSWFILLSSTFDGFLLTGPLLLSILFSHLPFPSGLTVFALSTPGPHWKFQWHLYSEVSWTSLLHGICHLPCSKVWRGLCQPPQIDLGTPFLGLLQCFSQLHCSSQATYYSEVIYYPMVLIFNQMLMILRALYIQYSALPHNVLNIVSWYSKDASWST